MPRLLVVPECQKYELRHKKTTLVYQFSRHQFIRIPDLLGNFVVTPSKRKRKQEKATFKKFNLVEKFDLLENFAMANFSS